MIYFNKINKLTCKIKHPPVYSNIPSLFDIPPLFFDKPNMKHWILTKKKRKEEEEEKKSSSH